MQKRKNEKGFTLVELLVVITIMGILGTLLVTNYTKYVDKSKQVVVDEQLSEIVKAFEVAFLENAKYDNTTLVDYSTILGLKVDIKLVYQELTGNTLPTGSILTMDSTTIVYSLNGKTATYIYAGE